MNPADDLTYQLVADAIYHRSRTTWFTVLHRLTMLISIFLSTSAVAAIIKKDEGWAIAASLVIALVTSLNLTFDFAGMARWHAERRRVYHDLVARLEECGGDEEACRKVRIDWIKESANEGAEFEAAMADANNAAILSLGRDRGGEFVIPWWHYWLRHVWPFRGTRYKTRDELSAQENAQRESTNDRESA